MIKTIRSKKVKPRFASKIGEVLNRDNFTDHLGRDLKVGDMIATKGYSDIVPALITRETAKTLFYVKFGSRWEESTRNDKILLLSDDCKKLYLDNFKGRFLRGLDFLLEDMKGNLHKQSIPEELDLYGDILVFSRLYRLGHNLIDLPYLVEAYVTPFEHRGTVTKFKHNTEGYRYQIIKILRELEEEIKL